MAKVNGADTSRGSWVLKVEIVHELGSVDVTFINPRVPFVSITFPSDQELKTIAEEAAVKDCFKFVLQFTINDYRIWPRCGVSAGIGSIGTLM
jgi:hypothetical protein